jgi:deoxyribodipyrimidine photo-lyase
LTAPLFPPSRAEAVARAVATDPQRYARTRNYLNGSVSRLSPYLTHGLIDTKTVIQLIAAKHPLDWNNKFVFELGWREYFSHVWSHLGETIWNPQHPTPASHYAETIPGDIAQANTGVAIIDQQVATLYRTGYLHNHARMWIASYVVHIRKVSWQAGARWMYPHLLDGDFASNTLSWQWVAGTWTGKPYLFNAENVARYAPGVDCEGSSIDQSYEALDELARSDRTMKPINRQSNHGIQKPDLFGLPPPALIQNTPTAAVPRSETVRWLKHPWSLHLPDDEAAIGVINTDFHRVYPWCAARWKFVLEAMHARCGSVLIGTTDELADKFSGMSLSALETMNPHYDILLKRIGTNRVPITRAFANPNMLKRSFTSFWNQVNREAFPL